MNAGWGALSFIAFGVMALCATAHGQTVADDCVTVSRPKAGTSVAHRFTDPAGTVSTSTTEYLAVSDTSVRLRLVHRGAYGVVDTVNDSTVRVEDDLIVVDTLVSSGTTAHGTYQNTVTFRPGQIGEPASRICRGRTWTVPAVAVSASGSRGGLAKTTTTDPGSGRVISVRESVTVPAGTFETVHYERVFDGANGHVVERAWLSVAHGINVKFTHDGPAGTATQVLTGIR